MSLYEDMKTVFQRYLETQRELAARKADMLDKKASGDPGAHAATVAYHVALGTHQAASILADSMQNKARRDQRTLVTMLKVKRDLCMVIPDCPLTLTDIVYTPPN